ncbi:MAG TPA: sigma-70 family RNA polymerase sigma factor, partial [Minicystis sp.]|nr:sigma-70 family RNA polymerase sigma factor [Minicystis sp.]
PTQEAHEARLDALLKGQAAALAIGLVSSSTLETAADPEASPEERVAAHQFRDRVRRVVADLPERERALVERHYFGDEPFDVIAKDLGISKSWASRLHAQAMRRLAGSLKE